MTALLGPARPHFTDVARLWSVVLDVEVSPEQVALCMSLLKIARILPHVQVDGVGRVPHDSIVDASGYLGLIEKMQT